MKYQLVDLNDEADGYTVLEIFEDVYGMRSVNGLVVLYTDSGDEKYIVKLAAGQYIERGVD